MFSSAGHFAPYLLLVLIKPPKDAQLEQRLFLMLFVMTVCHIFGDTFREYPNVNISLLGSFNRLIQN